MLYLRSLSSIALSAALLLGCGGSSGDGGSLINGSDGSGGGGRGHPDLQGAWRSDCFPLPVDDGPDEGQRLNYHFEGDRITQVVDVFEDQDCQGAPYFKPRMVWRYTVGEPFTSGDGVEVMPIDVELIDQDPLGIAEAEYEFDIFGFNSSGEELYLGLGGGASDEARRPTQLDFGFPMRRQ